VIYIMARVHIIFSVCMITILLTPLAHGHGGEASNDGLVTLGNPGVLIASIAASIFAWSVGREWLRSHSLMGTPLVFCLAVFTGLVHILLGLNDPTMMIGGLGVFGILLLSFFGGLNDYRGQLELALALVVVSMFVGYFYVNRELDYIAGDYLGIVTKLVEIGILQQLLVNSGMLKTKIAFS